MNIKKLLARLDKSGVLQDIQNTRLSLVYYKKF